MGEWELRRSLPRLATRAGLGEVHRVHHERRPVPVLLLAKLGVDWAMVLLLAKALSELGRDPGARPVAVLLWLALSWGGLAYWLLARDGRRWFAVCDGGLLVGTAGTDTIAIAWHTIEGLTPAHGPGIRHGSLRVSWRDGGKQRYVTFRMATDRDALAEAVEGKHPVPKPPHRRILAGAGIVAVASVVAWALTLSPLADIVMARRPYYLRDLASLCAQATAGSDAAYPESAPYEARAPHPAVLFAEEHDSEPVVTSTGTGSDTPDPDDVQLVACSRLERRTYDMTCAFSHGVSVSYYRARYRVDVYEARTGRGVTERTLDADDHLFCGGVMELDGKGGGHEEDVSVPSRDDYQHILDEVAAGVGE
ncbi:hypothetical protein [Streptomyces africanus]|uniref:hypothetical protein n=1 Tax=Streptomyces africanus TaxID=231024 RepID=UPI000A368202|nr:hypothetical protein [Streptomyces africanus]